MKLQSKTKWRLGSLIFVSTCFASAIAAAFQTTAPLPSRSNDPYQVRAEQLEQELAKRDAEILRLEIANSTCRATVEDREHRIEGLTYSERAVRMVDKYRQLFGGDWIWDKETSSVVPVKPGEKEKQR